jgi:transcriptional regulator with XRE-family HTH domain
MSPRRIAAIQSATLEAVKAASGADKPPTDAEVALAAGVDRTLVSKWRTGDREIGLADLVGLVEAFGAGVVLRSLASADDCDVVRRPEPGFRPESRILAAADLADEASSLTAAVARAEADGRVTDSEVDDLERRADRLGRRVAELRAALPRGPERRLGAR